MGKIVNVAVVGYGGMGGWHTRKLQEIPEVHLQGVYDILPERNKAAEEKGIKAYASLEELLDDSFPDLDLELDPKLSWALRHPECFPVDVNRADFEWLLRVPGVGVKSAKMIVMARRYGKIRSDQLKKMGVVMKRACYFITSHELRSDRTVQELRPERVRRLLTGGKEKNPLQLKLVFEE